MHIYKQLTFFALLSAHLLPVFAKPIPPIFQNPGKILFQDDFSSGTVSDQLKIQQNTQWSIESGTLVGKPAPESYQKSKPDHNGTSALIDLPLPEQNVILQLDVKFEGKDLSGAVELGHHVSKIGFSKKGIIVAGGSSKDTAKLKPEQGKWYSMVGEINGDELVVTIDGVKTFYVQDNKLSSQKKSIRIRGPKQGTIFLDNIKLYEASGTNPSWNNTKNKLAKK